MTQPQTNPQTRAEDRVQVTVRNTSGVGLAYLAAVIGWIGGIVLAKGWMTLLAIFFAPYGWYLFAERLMQVAGLLP